MAVFPLAVGEPGSLTAGWKVELGVGDPAAIPDVGVYDTSRYASELMAGSWERRTAVTGDGQYIQDRFAQKLQFSDVDDAGDDRRAEMLAVPVGTKMTWTGDSGTPVVEVTAVVPFSGSVEFHYEPFTGAISGSGAVTVFTWLDDAAVYGSDDPFGYLVDATSRVEGLTTRRGRERFTSRFRTGTAQVVVLNTDGAFTPPSGSGPIGILPLRPGRAVRITKDDGFVFDGWIDSFDGKQSRDGKVSMKINCVDSLGQFTRNDLPAVDPAEGSGERTFLRMTRLLDRHLVDYTFEAKGLDVARLQATTMAQDLLSELAITADSEGGAVWIGKHGQVVASGRDFFSDIVDSGVVRYTVGGTNPIKITAYGDEWAAIRIVNEAHMSRTGGTEQIRTNDSSIDKFGRRTHTRLDLINNDDTQVSVLAERLVQFAGIDRLRIKELTFLPEVGSPAAEMGVQAEFGDIMLVTITTLTGVQWTAPVQIFGVAHTVTPDRWLVSFLTDDTLFTGEFHAFDQTAFDPDAFS